MTTENTIRYKANTQRQNNPGLKTCIKNTDQFKMNAGNKMT